MGRKHPKTAVLFSGGYDSGVVFFKAPDDVDYVFFHYNQLYCDNECRYAKAFLREHGKELTEISYSSGYTDMPERNFKFLEVLKERGYTDVYMGTRNPFKVFDKYGDADGQVLRAKARELGIRLHMPVLWWTKGRVMRFLKKRGLLGSFYNCYRNATDYSECDCKNCRFRRRFGDG